VLTTLPFPSEKKPVEPPSSENARPTPASLKGQTQTIISSCNRPNCQRTEAAPPEGATLKAGEINPERSTSPAHLRYVLIDTGQKPDVRRVVRANSKSFALFADYN
jgi:hypothetical protein